MDVVERIAQSLRTQPEARAMEWQGQWWTRAQLATFADALDVFLCESKIPGDMAIGFVARNRPTHIAALAGLIASRRPVSMVYAFQSPTALAADIAKTKFGVLLIDEADWCDEIAAAASASGTLAVLLAGVPEAGFGVVTPAGQDRSTNPHRRLPGPGIEILSSGTTGAPKRVFHGIDMLFRSLESGFQSPVADTAPDLVFWPLSGIGGTLQFSSAMVKGNAFILHEKFTVEALVDAIRRYQMTSVAVTPTMLRMLYDANVPPDDLSSLIAFFGGSGPVDPALKDKVEARYGKPVIWAMGATEFCGTVIAWTLELHREFAATKRGSTGRPIAGCHVRIVDPDKGAVLPAGEVGRMEVRVDRMGPDWVATTDLAMIDDDGFVFHRGRSDGAIVRGGFKIIPETVCEVLRLYPAVAEAVLIGVPDERLGQVPVAAVELRRGASATARDLDQHLRARLAAPQIPVRYFFLDKLPLTASTKVNLRAVREIVEASL